MSTPTLSQTPKSSRKIPSESSKSPLLPCIDEIPDRYISVPGSVEIDRASYSPRYKDFLRHRIKEGNGTPIRGSAFGSPFQDVLSPKSPAPISPACSRRGNRVLESSITSPLTRFKSPTIDIGSPTLSSRRRLVDLGKSPCRFSPFRFFSKEHVSPSKRILVNELRIDPEDKLPPTKLSPPKLRLKEKSSISEKSLRFGASLGSEIHESSLSCSPSKRVLVEEFSQKVVTKKHSPIADVCHTDPTKTPEHADTTEPDSSEEPSSPTPFPSQNSYLGATVESNRDVFLSSLQSSVSKKIIPDNLDNLQEHVFSPVRKASIVQHNKVENETVDSQVVGLCDSATPIPTIPTTVSSPSKRTHTDTDESLGPSESPSPSRKSQKTNGIESESNTVLPSKEEAINSAQIIPTPTQTPSSSQDSASKTKALVEDNKSKPLPSNQIPRFYYPLGKPYECFKIHQAIVRELSLLQPMFQEEGFVTEDTFYPVTTAFQLPRYFSLALFNRICELVGSSSCLSWSHVVRAWHMMKREYKSVDSFAFYLLKQRGNDYLVADDFDVILRDVMSGHQELDFLVGNDSFQDRYAETVIARIFYDHNRSWTGRMTFSEFKRGKIVNILRRVELGIDCGQQTRRKRRTCFSYKDFYVIYSKFWELDDDHDLEISETDLCYYAQGSLTEKVVKRVIQGCGKPTDLSTEGVKNEPRMSYRDFVWFILSEVNKNTPTAIEYWFRCLDTDGDGILSLYELESFYEEQTSRMEYARVKRIPYMDSICQMFDLVNPVNKSFIALGDLKRMREPAIFFDMFFNLARYIEHENRPKKLRMRRKMGGRHSSRLGSNPWDEYVDIEYDRLIPPLGDEDDEDTEGDVVFGAHQGGLITPTPSSDQLAETLLNEGESSTVTSY